MPQSAIQIPQGNQGTQGIQGPVGPTGPPGPGYAWKTYSWDADQLEVPNNADWSIATPAAGEEDSNNAAIIVRAFDDSTTEGAGFSAYIPPDSTSIVLRVKHRGAGTAGAVVWAFRYREIPDNGAIGSWTNFTLTNASLPANTNYQYFSEEVTLATLSMNDDTMYQFEVIRDGANGSDTLVGDWYIANVQLDAKWEMVFRFPAPALRSPDNADWAVNAFAPIASDSNNNALTVRLFDDTTEEGVGFALYVPYWAVNMTLSTISRAETTPVGTVGASLDLYERNIGNNVAVPAWVNAGTLAVSLPTNELWQYDETTDTIANWSLTAGTYHQFELTRDTDDSGDDLVGDLALLEIGIMFT